MYFDPRYAFKTYVREGLGVGIIANLAYQEDQESDLGLRNLSHLFAAEVTKIACAKDKYLRRFQQRFIDLFQKETVRFARGKRAHQSKT